MTFNSIVFLFCFLPLALLAYHLAPARFRNAVLLAESVLFYTWSSAAFLPLALVLILLNYLAALAMERWPRWLWLVLSIVCTAAALAWFKYDAYLAALLQRIAGAAFGGLHIADVLPLGISYYTFKLISYTADVCTGKVKAERDPVAFAAYVLAFPQLIVGPIVRYRDLRAALHDPAGRCTLARAEAGAEEFVFGLAKKVLLADGIGALWQGIIGADGVGLANVSTPLAWLGIVAYSFQLYFDFSGFSQMSNGISRMLGFDCPANFAHPYTAASVTEFWRRWHITLSAWFRDYIYIPLGGNRRGLRRQILNLLAVWALTGIWHGSEWNFLCWGLYYFVVLTLEKSFLLKRLQAGRVWPHIYTLFVVVLGWGLFTCNAPGAPLGLLLQKLFLPQGGIAPWYYLRCYGVTLILCALCSTALPAALWQRLRRRPLLRLAAFAALAVLSVAFVVGATSSTALYADF